MSKSEKVKTILVGKNLIVRDINESRKLYAQGFYGKPLGIEKPKDPNFDSPLILNSLEGLYLAEKKVIEVVDTHGNKLDINYLKNILLASERMKLLYDVYKDLRNSGFVVRPGMKFGADFAIYRYGPGIDHAPFIVTVVKKGVKVDPIEIVRAGRLSHSVKKTFILALKDSPEKIYYLMFKWFKL